MDEAEELLATWGRRGAVETRARLRTFNGATYFDVRLFALNADGETVPTRKGICLSVDHLDDLAAAVAEARRRLEADE